MKQRIAFAAIMGFITTGIISASLVAFNYGLHPGFFTIWFLSWLVSFPLALMAALFVGPRVQVLVNYLFKESVGR
ncbi:MAG TPA: DUF2798 domain-containing protein [Chitinophagales bacterium]|nr:DUF2798 domain-containing protein [Chitinophagales bacterium]